MQSIDGFSIKVSWVQPTGDMRGPIDRYELKAYNRDNPDVPPVKTTYQANGNFTGKPNKYIVLQSKVVLNLWNALLYP